MPLPNMSTNSATYQKKVESAMQILQNTTGVRVPQAMILAGFLKSDIASKTVCQAARRRRQQKQNNACTGRPAPTEGIVLISNEPSLSELTVVVDPTKWHKPKPPSFVDYCVPHHCRSPLLFGCCHCPRCHHPCCPCPRCAHHHPHFCHCCRHRRSCMPSASNNVSTCASFVDGMGFVMLLPLLPSYPSCLASLTSHSIARHVLTPRSLLSPSLAGCCF
jgi:hypothetical protein